MKIFAADIGGTSIKMCISNDKGDISLFSEIPTNSQNGGPYIIDTLKEHIRKHHHLDAIGISTAGQVDTTLGKIIYANENIPNYTGMEIKQILEKEFHVPVRVENDVNCAALGEKEFGAGKNKANFLCLTYGTGIGGAIIHQDELLRGKNGIAAEFGHMIIHGDGLACNCGRYGCYEQYASTTALIKQAQSIDRKIENGRQLFTAIEAGNIPLQQILDDWVHEITIGLVSLTHIFNPETIIIGGGIMEREEIVQMVKEQLKKKVMQSYQDVNVVKASLGNKAGLLGAVSLFR